MFYFIIFVFVFNGYSLFDRNFFLFDKNFFLLDLFVKKIFFLLWSFKELVEDGGCLMRVLIG